MDFDQLLLSFFGTAELERLSGSDLAAGREQLAVELGLETDRGRRFALWCLAHMLGSAPDLDVTFDEPADRDAARTFMDTVARESGDGGAA